MLIFKKLRLPYFWQDVPQEDLSYNLSGAVFIQPTVQQPKIFTLQSYDNEKDQILTFKKVEMANVLEFFLRKTQPVIMKMVKCQATNRLIIGAL